VLLGQSCRTPHGVVIDEYGATLEYDYQGNAQGYERKQL
jgi:hypothetical protein